MRGWKLKVYTNNVAEIIGNHNLNGCSKADIYIRVVCKFNATGKVSRFFPFDKAEDARPPIFQVATPSLPSLKWMQSARYLHVFLRDTLKRINVSEKSAETI